MTWRTFLVIHFMTSFLFVFLSKELLRGKRLRLLRVVAAAFALSFFIDYPAEDREIWFFPSPSTSTLIKVPIENMVFIASCVPYIIVFYLLFQNLVRSRAERSRNPKA